MLLYILYAILAVVIICLVSIFYEKLASKTKHVPEPWNWPLLKHYPFFWNRDHPAVYDQLAKPYKKDGMFKINNLSLPEQVVLLDPNFPKFVLGRPELFERSNVIQEVCPFIKHGLLLAKGDAHRRQKKLLSRAFTADMLNTYFIHSNHAADRLVETWKSAVNNSSDGTATIDVLPHFLKMAESVVVKSLLDLDMDEQNEFLQSILNVLELLSDATLLKVIFKQIPFVNYLPFGPLVQRQKSMKRINDVLTKLINKRRKEIIEKGISKKDLVTICLKTQIDQDTDGDQPLTDLEIRDNIVTFYIGGFETTSSASTWITYALCKYPEIQEKLRDEILKVVDKDVGMITVTHVNQIQYLDMVIKETLRFYNTSIRVGRLATQDCYIGDYWIPKGQMIKTVLSLFHNNDDLFPEADKFDPERFRDPRNVKVGSWLAFGYGPYSCIGKKFAINELKVVICKLLLKFRLDFKDGKPTPIQRGIKIALFNNIPIELKVTIL